MGLVVGLWVGVRVGFGVRIRNIPISPEVFEEEVGLPVGVPVGLMALL